MRASRCKHVSTQSEPNRTKPTGTASVESSRVEAVKFSAFGVAEGGGSGAERKRSLLKARAKDARNDAGTWLGCLPGTISGNLHEPASVRFCSLQLASVGLRSRSARCYSRAWQPKHAETHTHTQTDTHGQARMTRKCAAQTDASLSSFPLSTEPFHGSLACLLSLSLSARSLRVC